MLQISWCFPAGQLAKHAAVSALDRLELQDGVIDPETVEKLVADLFRKGFGFAHELIRHLHVTGKGRAGRTHIPGVEGLE